MRTFRKKFEFRNKCRCGVWLFNDAARRGYCFACGPESAVVSEAAPEEKEGDDEAK